MCCLRPKESLQRENISTEYLRSHGEIEMSLLSILPTFPESYSGRHMPAANVRSRQVTTSRPMEGDRDHPRLTGKPEVNCRQQAVTLKCPAQGQMSDNAI